MAIVGIDDTDSRTQGMCTTWIATEIIRQLGSEHATYPYLIRLCPSIPHKTRGNGAVAIQTDAAPDQLAAIATAVVDEWHVQSDPETNPGIVLLPDVRTADSALFSFATAAIKRPMEKSAAVRAIEASDGSFTSFGNGRGIIGSTAAVGAAAAQVTDRQEAKKIGPWTVELLAYRERDRWGTERTFTVSFEDVGDAVRSQVWDTVDPVTGDPVCIPHSPCPVGYGIRGTSLDAIKTMADGIHGEPVERIQHFLTNQGSDGHLTHARLDDVVSGRSYRVSGIVSRGPTYKEGGHVSFAITDGESRLSCMAFSPTGRFREQVAALIPGDRIIADGEVTEGTLKLEKFALQARRMVRKRSPVCPSCTRRMKSAGRGQGYRCKRCDTAAPNQVNEPIERDIDPGWFEVPPGARRHLAQPLALMEADLRRHPTSGEPTLSTYRS